MSWKYSPVYRSWADVNKAQINIPLTTGKAYGNASFECWLATHVCSSYRHESHEARMRWSSSDIRKWEHVVNLNVNIGIGTDILHKMHKHAGMCYSRSVDPAVKSHCIVLIIRKVFINKCYNFDMKLVNWCIYKWLSFNLCMFMYISMLLIVIVMKIKRFFLILSIFSTKKQGWRVPHN